MNWFYDFKPYQITGASLTKSNTVEFICKYHIGPQLFVQKHVAYHSDSFVVTSPRRRGSVPTCKQ